MPSAESLTLTQCIDSIPSKPSPHKELLLDLNDRRLAFTAEDLQRATKEAAKSLHHCWSSYSHEPIKGVAVCIALPNCSAYITTYLAVAGLGAVNALLNQRFKEEEFKYALKDMGCKMLIVAPDGCPAAEAAAAALGIPVASVGWLFDTQPPTPIINPKSPPTFSPRTDIEIKDKPKGSDICLLLHTSGTTASPKSVPLTHRNNVISIMNIARTYDFGGSDTGLLVMPLFHVHGLFAGCLSPLANGSRVVLARGDGFHRSTFWEDAVEAKATWATAVPTIWQIILAHKHEHPTPPVHFRFIRGCSSALPAAVAEQLEDYLKTEVLEAYAMSEATHQMCSNPLGGRRRFGSVGLPQGIEVAIVDSETRKVVSRNVAGEVCVRGYNIIEGYLNLEGPDQQKHFYSQKDLVDASADGASFCSTSPDLFELNRDDYLSLWSAYRRPLSCTSQIGQSLLSHKPFLRTGDIGKMDRDGFVWLVGRSKEFINRGGEKISPLEIDAEFLKNEHVEEAGAYGEPDPILGEVVHLCVVLRQGVQPSEELFASMRAAASKSLAKFKIPVKIYACPALPKGNTGKILRRELGNYVKEHKDMPCF